MLQIFSSSSSLKTGKNKLECFCNFFQDSLVVDSLSEELVYWEDASLWQVLPYSQTLASTSTLTWTNTIAYHRIRILRTRNVFIVLVPGFKRKYLSCPEKIVKHKHFSLFCHAVSEEEKRFITFDTRCITLLCKM